MFLKTGTVENKFPWYKERLQMKYLRDLNHKQQLSGALDGRRWRFLSPGQDDFRDGYPTVHKEPFTRCDCGPAPVVFGMPKNQCSVKLPQKRLSKDQACYSKQNPQSQTQRGFIDAVEHRLKQHPMALHPHLESGMTPELFDQVLSVLEPDMCVKKKMSTSLSTNEMQLSADDHHNDPLPDTFQVRKACEPNRPQSSKTCAKKSSNDPFRRPSDITNNLDSEEQLNEQDEEPKQSYAIQAFRQYIINKRLEMPRATCSHAQFLSVLFCKEEQENKIRASNIPGSSSTSKGRAHQQKPPVKWLHCT